MMTEEQNKTLISVVQAASKKWQAAFNAGDAPGCAMAYEENSVVNVTPFGSFSGRPEIEAFWVKIISDGFADVEYIEPEIKVIDDKSAVLSSKWRMNNAHGIITKELWVIQPDGTALLREDDFEILG